MSDPEVVTRAQWLAARRELLAREKELTRHRDEVNAARRRLPMVEITKEYSLDGPRGKVGLADLFGGRSQLLIYHFMFGPDQDEGCPACSFWIDNVGHLNHLYARDTSLAAGRLARSVGQARALQAANGLGSPVVLIAQQRLHSKAS